MDKLLILEKNLKNLKKVVVAYSGGVDSSLLLAVAHNTLGNNILAVTAFSELMTEKELDEARTFADSLGVQHLLVLANDLEHPEFTENNPRRCYFCKKNRLLQMKKLADDYKIPWVIEGSNLDDLNDYRPGEQAIRELGIKSPLQEIGFTKKEVRNLANKLGLPSWNKPSQPCFATRIPYGTTITREALERVKKAEACLIELLRCQQVRVRDYGTLARLEVPPEIFPLIIKPAAAQAIYKEMKHIGYTHTSLDLLGYRQGSMNENTNTGVKNGYAGKD